MSSSQSLPAWKHPVDEQAATITHVRCSAEQLVWLFSVRLDAGDQAQGHQAR